MFSFCINGEDGANKKYYVDSSNYSNIASNNADLFYLCSFFVFQQLLLSARWYRDKLKVTLKCWDIKILKEDMFIHPIGGKCRNWHMRFGMAIKCNVSHERESVQILLAIYTIEQSNAFIYPTTS